MDIKKPESYTALSFLENKENEPTDYCTFELDDIEVSEGDIFEIGNHRIMCGDSTIERHVDLLFGGKKAHLLITDPPYNVDYVGGTVDKLKIKNDSFKDSDAFRLFLSKAFQNCDKHLIMGSAFYICHADSESYNFRGACLDTGWAIRQCLIWVKSSLVMGRQDYHWQHEPILYGWKEGAPHRFYGGRNQTTIFNFDKPVKSELHPTIKPIPLFMKLIENSTQKDEIVVDLFGGVGTSIIASEHLKRTCYTMELDPLFVSRTLQRVNRIFGLSYKKVN